MHLLGQGTCNLLSYATGQSQSHGGHIHRMGKDAPLIDVTASHTAVCRDSPPSERGREELRIRMEPTIGLSYLSTNTSAYQWSSNSFESLDVSQKGGGCERQALPAEAKS